MLPAPARSTTGDLSAVLPGLSPCGRSNTRLVGWLGRADQTTKIKGLFVHPGQVAEVIKRHPQIAKVRLVVSRHDQSDVMTLRCELAAPGAGTTGGSGAPGGTALGEAIAATLQAVCKLRAKVDLVAPGALPNDGLVIEDARGKD